MLTCLPRRTYFLWKDTISQEREDGMRLGIMGRLFPALFGKAVYGYTARALPDMDIREFKKKLMSEYKAMVARTPFVGSAKENMFAPVMYLACFGFSYYKAAPERITMDVFDGMIDAISCSSASPPQPIHQAGRRAAPRASGRARGCPGARSGAGSARGTPRPS